RVGAGSTFHVHFPVAEGVQAPEAPPPPEPAPTGAGTVLLVEDDDSVGQLAQELLASSGYRVLRARDGVEALEVADASREPIVALLTDVVMPRMGGAEL